MRERGTHEGGEKEAYTEAVIERGSVEAKRESLYGGGERVSTEARSEGHARRM